MVSGLITSRQIDRETVADFIFGASKIPADGDGSHKIKTPLLLGRNVMTNLDSSSSLHGILQERIPEWVAISFSRGSSQLRDRTQVSCTAGRQFNHWATREAQC